MPIATLTSKGQVTIPLPIRERLRLKPDDQIDFSFTREGIVTLRPKRIPFEELLGILRNPRQKSVRVREMDKGIEKAVRDRWARKNARGNE